MAEVPPFIKVTPSFAPDGTSIFVGPTGVGVIVEFFLHEAVPINRMLINKKYIFLIIICFVFSDLFEIFQYTPLLVWKVSEQR